MNPYSGTSSLAKVRADTLSPSWDNCFLSLMARSAAPVGWVGSPMAWPPTARRRRRRCCCCCSALSDLADSWTHPPCIIPHHHHLQVLRISAVGLGLVYGTVKLSLYKSQAAAAAKQQQAHHH